MGVPRSFSIAAAVDALLWMITTGTAMVFILKGKVQEHRHATNRSVLQLQKWRLQIARGRNPSLWFEVENHLTVRASACPPRMGPADGSPSW